MPHQTPRSVTLTLLATRSPGATICPSEVARMLASKAAERQDDWRDFMPAVHAAVDLLVADGLVKLSWKGRPVAPRVGPYRIGRDDRG